MPCTKIKLCNIWLSILLPLFFLRNELRIEKPKIGRFSKPIKTSETDQKPFLLQSKTTFE
jgi:hypothetical protein